jgi:osmotically-inducible protein OsmY
MKDKLSLVVGIAAGALAMYYLDPLAGRRRRALVRDRLVSTGHDAAYFTGRKAKRAADRVKGYLATHRPGRHDGPESDRQLHDRIRARLGHVMHSPRSVEVQVEQGRVCLRGHVLRPELDRVLHEVNRMAGVASVESHLVTHETAAGIPPPGTGALEQRAAAATMH